ncbi:MAG: sulfotransferase family protein [Planctomycetaceae bacterium]
MPVWFGLLAENRLRVSPEGLGLLATVTALSAFNSLAGPMSDARFARRLRSRKPHPAPLFIVGHWRSGTTLLHELMMLDEEFCCPNTYQCFVPGHFLLTESVLTWVMSGLIPPKRPMDDVAAGWDRPQEDEFALMNMGAPSPYRRMAFPATAPDHPEALDLLKLSQAERDRWKRAMNRFLVLLSARDPRRPVLKSPPHTARIGDLSELFPEARFLHIVRDPFVVFPSTVRLWRSLHAVQALQRDRLETIEPYVFNAFDEMYGAFERDRGAVGSRLHEVRYESLVADPVATLSTTYEALGLGDFGRMRPALERHVASMRTYRTNRYEIDPDFAGRIAAHCDSFIKRYGYETAAPTS